MTAVLNEISEGPALEPVHSPEPAPPREPPAAVQSLGDLLRTRREAIGLSAQQAAEQLRLLPHWIDAFESNRFDSLVAPVYSRGYLRKYAILLDLPPDDILAQYEKLHDIPPAPALQAIKPTASQSVKTSRVPVFLAGAALVAVAAALFISQMEPPKEQLEPTATVASPATTATPAPAPAEPTQVAAASTETPAQTSDVAPADAAVMPAAEETVASEATSTTTVPEAAPAPEAAALTPAAAPEAAPQPVEATAEPTADDAEPAIDAPLARVEVPVSGRNQTLNVKLSFKDKSWTTVYAADGTRLLYELSRKGRPRMLSSKAPMTIIVGAIDATELRVNGKLVEIPRQPGKDSVKFILDVEGAQRSASDVGSGG